MKIWDPLLKSQHTAPCCLVIEVVVLLGVGPPGGVGTLPEVPLLHALHPRLSPCSLPRLQSGHIQLYTFCRYSTFEIFNVQGECMAIPSYIG